MKVLFILFTFFLATTSFANNPGVSYQGRIFKPDGNPLEGSSVQFRLQVRSPGSENCLLYEEVQTLNMAGSSGVFALTLNDGTGTRLDAATYQVDRIFANRETMTLDTTRCASGTTYAPNSSDGRKLVVYFKDETMAAYEAMPLMNLNYVPQAMYALEAQKVDKFEVSHILRAVDVSGNPVAAPALNPTQLTNLNTLLATPAANYVQTTTNGSAALPVVAGNPSSGLAAGQIWYDSGSNVMKYYDGAVKTFGTSSGLSSVGLTLPGMFSVTNSPLTANGSITATLANQTANTVFAGPASGGPAAPTFRALASTDLPITGAAGTFINGGNSFGVAGNIGTNDAFDLNLKTNNTTKMTILSNGNVGIGTTTPTQRLDVVGQIHASGDICTDAGGGKCLSSAGGGSSLIGLTGAGPSFNTTLGVGAGTATTIGIRNSLFGFNAGLLIQDGNNNTAVGYLALASTTNSEANTAIGDKALNALSSGTYNSAIGAGSMKFTTSGTYNAAFGTNSLYNNISGDHNTAVGDRALNGVTTGIRNVGIGHAAGNANQGGAYNVYVGDVAGYEKTSGDNNVFIGANAGYNNLTGDRNVFIGSHAGENETGSDKLYIANTNTPTPLIYGDFSSEYVGIGTSTPSAKLHVYGDFKTGQIQVGSGTRVDGMGICEIGNQTITNAEASYSCSGIPGEDIVVHCSGAQAMTSAGSNGLYCRASGTSGQVICNTVLANSVPMKWVCMWMYMTPPG
ncbi:MAG: hypothetical protein J0M15_11835 [Deltaproteobacteria bacterium]|nr:hypothetical protein [Deltaproteobacteria bacterium]